MKYCKMNLLVFRFLVAARGMMKIDMWFDFLERSKTNDAKTNKICSFYMFFDVAKHAKGNTGQQTVDAKRRCVIGLQININWCILSTLF